MGDVEFEGKQTRTTKKKRHKSKSAGSFTFASILFFQRPACVCRHSTELHVRLHAPNSEHSRSRCQAGLVGLN
jgi:hypothetical protein